MDALSLLVEVATEFLTPLLGSLLGGMVGRVALEDALLLALCCSRIQPDARLIVVLLLSLLLIVWLEGHHVLNHPFTLLPVALEVTMTLKGRLLVRLTHLAWNIDSHWIVPLIGSQRF